ncbi:MAG: phosphate propanoyltransferase [bacterium]
MTDNLRSEVERLVRQVVESMTITDSSRRVPMNISARHLHITQEDLETLFGRGAQLTKYRDLMQPGEFASNETISVIGTNRKVFEQVRILGPARKATQVELTFSDGRYLGMQLPARISGNIKDTAPIIIVGPKGILHLKEGTIRALRHVHMSKQDAQQLGLEQGQTISVRTEGAMGVTFDQVVVRIGENALREMHIDTDEANAAGLTRDASGIIL